MPKIDVTEIVNKQVKNTQNAKSAYIYGIKNPDRDPKQAAIAAEGKMREKWLKSIDDGNWKKGVETYDMAEAIRVAEKIGADNLVRGVAERRSKLAKFWGGWAPILESAKNTVQAMPQDTEAERKARMDANFELMKANKGKWR